VPNANVVRFALLKTQARFPNLLPRLWVRRWTQRLVERRNLGLRRHGQQQQAAQGTQQQQPDGLAPMGPHHVYRHFFMVHGFLPLVEMVTADLLWRSKV